MRALSLAFSSEWPRYRTWSTRRRDGGIGVPLRSSPHEDRCRRHGAYLRDHEFPAQPAGTPPFPTEPELGPAGCAQTETGPPVAPPQHLPRSLPHPTPAPPPPHPPHPPPLTPPTPPP